MPFGFRGFDFLQLRHSFGGDECREFFVTLGDVQAEFRRASDEAGIGIGFELLQQFGESGRTQEFFSAAFVTGRAECGVAVGKARGELIFVAADVRRF